jgi:SAM-dependent methyltransferase
MHKNSSQKKESLAPPPNVPPGQTITSRIMFRLRRFLDLQVSSVLTDLTPWLATLHGTILEVGCGAQPYRHLVPERCCYIGLDWHQTGAVFGYKAKGIIHFNGKHFPLKAASVDSVFHTEVLEHVKDPAAFLTECFRVLKPSGKMFLSVPFQARYHYIPYDYWRFTPSGLELLLRHAGFTQFTILPRGNDVTVAAYKSISVIYRLLLGNIFNKFLGILLAPTAAIILPVGHFVSKFKLGSDDDCLGYNVIATTPCDRERDAPSIK